MSRRRLLLALPLLLLAGRARADVEETERRLKAVGVDPVLQAEIQTAIGRAVRYLRSQQRPDGGFGESGWRGLGRAALCAFALRHAGSPQAMEGVARARAYLFPEGRQTYEALLGDVYGAGLALLFLHADRRRTETHGERHVKRLLFALAEAQDEESGWWHYKTPAYRPTATSWREHVPNLSTSQFAALGLWAGQRFVRERPTPVWRRHLRSLFELQTPDGSWPYDPIPADRGTAVRHGPVTYATATTMGLASLVLAEAALGEDDPDMRRTRAERAEVRARALAALRRQAPWTLRGLGNTWPFYSLYALEKACVFLGLERLGDVAWYREGATRLVHYQGDDGGWSVRAWQAGVPDPAAASDLEESAFALLFLLRTSETLRPVTPSPVDHDDAIVTGEAAPPAADPDPPAPPPDPRVPFTKARARLDRLREAVGDRSGENDVLLVALDAVGEAYAHLAPDPGLERLFEAIADRWREEAEAVLLDAFVLVRRDGSGRNLREPVVERSAQLLGGTNPRVSERLRRLLLQTHVEGRTPAGPQALGAGFDALADLGDPASATWLVRTFLDTDQRPERAARTERLLRALARFRSLPGDVRRDLTERILRAFESVEDAARAVQFGVPAGTPLTGVTWPTFFYWEQVRYDAVLAVHALAADPRTGEIPRAESGGPVQSMSELRTWWNDNAQPGRSPWR